MLAAQVVTKLGKELVLRILQVGGWGNPFQFMSLDGEVLFSMSLDGEIPFSIMSLDGEFPLALVHTTYG